MVLGKDCEARTSVETTVPCVKKADVHLLEPVFVNPNSHEVIEIILRTVGESAGVKQYGGSERCWLPIECDGLPYTLVRTVIFKAQQKANEEASLAAGIPDVAKMTKARLKEELDMRGLSKQGTVPQLKQRLQEAVSADLSTGKVTAPGKASGEFNWVVLRSGGLHWEMKLLECAVEVLWPFVYQAFADSQGYTTERQQEWVKSCKDHHRSWDEVSRFLDSTFDELLYPYVLDSEEPSPYGFYRWAPDDADSPFGV